MYTYLIALVWGFSEATLFFIVPDVWISILALQSLQSAVIACFYSLGGAMLGGLIMYFLGRSNPQRLNALLGNIPAIRNRDIQKVKSNLARSGVTAVLLGPTLGIPYKIYAVNAHTAISIYAFLLVSIPARIIRFLLLALLVSFISDNFLASQSSTGKVWTVCILWIIFYIAYFFSRRR